MVHFEKRLADTFGKGRIWLAGDAAHMAPPAGMLSMNEGMLEAADLADKLSSDAGDDARRFLLDAYNLDHITEWRQLLDVDNRLQGVDESAEWLLKHRSNIIGNLPASGQAYEDILEQLGLSDSVVA
jgi:2-polyprenyl-6-methoxyphenol hydroxylase-like FAD-dependent oxidoreductase